MTDAGRDGTTPVGTMSFDRLGADYDRSRSLPPEILRAAIGQVTTTRRRSNQASRALDCGCGTGQFLPALHASDWRPIGIDLAETSLRAARRRCPAASVALADGTRLPFRRGAFGLVVVAHVVEHVAAWREFVAECRRVAAGGVVVFVSTPGFVRNGPRSAMRRALRKRGWDVLRPGPAGLDELAGALRSDGTKGVRVTDPAWRWHRTQPVSASLEFLDRRAYSAFWECPDALYRDALDEVRRDFSARIDEVESIPAELGYLAVDGED